MEAIRSAPELLVHAIAIEREAAERYAEFAQRMGDLGNDAVAEVFGSLAGFEARHLDELIVRARGLALPKLEVSQYLWIDAGAPETAARELVYQVMSPRQALLIALAAEKRAAAFFERALMAAEDPALRTLAAEMALEEQEHVSIVERMLERTPAPVDWASL
jgi:rubrerythrin